MARVEVGFPETLLERIDTAKPEGESRTAFICDLVLIALNLAGDASLAPSAASGAPAGPTMLPDVEAGHRRHVEDATEHDGRVKVCRCGAVRAGSGPWLT